MKISPRDLQLIAALVYEQSGIVLDQSKAFLLESRLTPLIA